MQNNEIFLAGSEAAALFLQLYSEFLNFEEQCKR